MQTIIPRERLLKEILGDLADAIPGLDPQNVVTGLAIVEFANRCWAGFEAHFARYGLSQGRFTVLMFLHHFSDTAWTPASLAHAAGVRRATMTGLLEVLEKGKWTVRRPNPDDGRSNVIRLSAGGRRRLKKMLPDHFARVAAAMAGLSAAEHKKLIELMTKFGGHVATLAPGGAAMADKSGAIAENKSAIAH